MKLIDLMIIFNGFCPLGGRENPWFLLHFTQIPNYNTVYHFSLAAEYLIRQPSVVLQYFGISILEVKLSAASPEQWPVSSISEVRRVRRLIFSSPVIRSEEY